MAEAIATGGADAGGCVRLVSAAAGLDFLPVQEEAYDVGIPERRLHDRRVRALIALVRSPGYRQSVGELPGYSAREIGALASLG